MTGYPDSLERGSVDLNPRWQLCPVNSRQSHSQAHWAWGGRPDCSMTTTLQRSFFCLRDTSLHPDDSLYMVSPPAGLLW